FSVTTAPATTTIYTLSLHDALPIWLMAKCIKRRPRAAYFTLVPVGMAYYRDIVFVAVLKLLRIPLIFHLHGRGVKDAARKWKQRSEEHTSELQSRFDLVCRLLLEKK